MSAFNDRGVVLRAITSVVVAVASVVPFSSSLAAEPVTAQSPWLAVDRNRSSVVDAIVTRWRDTAALHHGQPGVLSESDLRDALQKLRADHLFSASLAGSYAGVIAILTEAGALDASARPSKVNAKSNAAPELAYTAITPCRIVDTRFGGGGFIGNNGSRNWQVAKPGGSFTNQGGVAGDCGIPAGPSAVMANVVVTGSISPGVLYAWPFGQPAPSASLLNYSGGQTIANGAIISVARGQGSDLSVLVSSATNVIIDILGYFTSPSGGNVLSVAPSGAQFTSIQAAIDAAIAMGAADGNSFVVNIAPGVYDEQVTLKDWVDLHGPGSTAGGIVYTGVGPAVIAGAQSTVREIGIFSLDTVSNPAVAVQQSNTTAAGFTSFQWAQIIANSGGPSGNPGVHDNVAINVDNGFIHILNSDVGTGPGGAGNNQTAIVASNSANVRFANGRLTPSAGGTTRLVAKQNVGAVIKIDNSELRGTTVGTPSCVYVFGQNYQPVACP